MKLHSKRIGDILIIRIEGISRACHQQCTAEGIWQNYLWNWEAKIEEAYKTIFSINDDYHDMSENDVRNKAIETINKFTEDT